MIESTPRGQRIDSWKSIAQYLQRDVATVRRWEKAHGLPIHRIGLAGRSVFAYTCEIDDWLSRRRPISPPLETSDASLASPAPDRAYPRRYVILAAGVFGAIAFFFAALKWRTSTSDLRIEATSTELIARTHAGAERWRYRFPATFDTANLAQMVHFAAGARPGVYFATRVRGSRADEQVESGVLISLDLAGRLQRSFSFDDTVSFESEAFGPPWALTSFAVNEGDGERSIAIAAHHYVWDPGLVTILDERLKRRGTFVNAGWIEAVRWLAPERLLIAGFSNSRDAGMVALLDAAAIDGQGPESAGSRDFCENCGPHRPLRMFVFPRTELNRVTGARFNRVVIQTLGGRVLARTIEAASEAGDVDAIYEFSAPAMKFLGAKFSERYWELHLALEAEGKITHAREQCPDRDGPRHVLAWEPATGWRTIGIR
ncbi:MAG: hypothetical protein ACR2L6_00810 [Gemmatimonadaceae bacterium]